MDKKIMKKRELVLMVVLLLIQIVSSKYIDIEYETYSDDEISNSSKILYDDDSYSIEVHDLYKREISEPSEEHIKINNNPINETTVEQYLNLSNVISRIENAFLKSASNIIEAFKNFKSNSTILRNLREDENESEKSTDISEHRIAKRTTSETVLINSDTKSIRAVPSTQEVPVHVFVDKIAIYPSTGYFPMLPTFDYHLAQQRNVEEDKQQVSKDETKTSTKTLNKRSVEESTTTTAATSVKLLTTEKHNNSEMTNSTENSLESLKLSKSMASILLDSKTEKSIESSTSVSTSTEASSVSNSTTTTFSTTRDPVKELKEEEEEEVKEKIAEIEAEPIILSSRV